MEDVWQQTVKYWQIKNTGVARSKKEFPGLLKQTSDKVGTIENAAHGFRKTGLFILTVNGIDMSKLTSSTAANPPDADNKTDKEKNREPDHPTKRGRECR